jgi:hypothetical protein
VLQAASADTLNRLCTIGDDEPVTLEFLMADYVVHLKHHLAQILGGEPFTQR